MDKDQQKAINSMAYHQQIRKIVLENSDSAWEGDNLSLDFKLDTVADAKRNLKMIPLIKKRLALVKKQTALEARYFSISYYEIDFLIDSIMIGLDQATLDIQEWLLKNG